MSDDPRPPETEEERIARASELAVKAAQEAWEVRQRLARHEERLNAINGSVERAAKNFAACEAANQKLSRKLDEIIAAQTVRDAVAETTQHLVQQQSRGQIKRRDLVLTVLTLLIALGAVATQITSVAGH